MRGMDGRGGNTSGGRSVLGEGGWLAHLGHALYLIFTVIVGLLLLLHDKG